MLPGLAPLAGFVAGGMSGGLGATVSEDTISKTGSTYTADKVVTTNSVTVTVAGGSGSYSHSWASADAINTSATDPAGASTAFTALLEAGANEVSHWIDTVTDTVTGAQYFVGVEVTLTLVSFA
jgi:hypothetical protein